MKESTALVSFRAESRNPQERQMYTIHFTSLWISPLARLIIGLGRDDTTRAKRVEGSDNEESYKCLMVCYY